MTAKILKWPHLPDHYIPRNEVIAEKILARLEKARRAASLYEIDIKRSLLNDENSYSQWDLGEASGHEGGLLEAIYLINQMLGRFI